MLDGLEEELLDGSEVFSLMIVIGDYTMVS